MAKRKELKKMLEVRSTFSGEFVRLGSKSGYKGAEITVLLRNITDKQGEVVTDHLWFNFTKGFAALGELVEGDLIRFDARVKTYQKGYMGRRDVYDKPVQTDYKLSHPSKVSRIQNVSEDKE